jgi:hypothetical protein
MLVQSAHETKVDIRVTALSDRLCSDTERRRITGVRPRCSCGAIADTHADNVAVSAIFTDADGFASAHSRGQANLHLHADAGI